MERVGKGLFWVVQGRFPGSGDIWESSLHPVTWWEVLCHEHSGSLLAWHVDS